MLSRRNVRIKVMQMLYSMSRDKELTFERAMRRYQEQVGKAFELYLANLLYLIHLAEYARVDAGKRHAKLLPSDEDRQFSAKLADNPLIESLRTNTELGRLFTRYQLDRKVDEDIVRQVYTEFAKSPEYKEFVYKAETTIQEHREQMLKLFKLSVNHEIYADMMEDHYPQWVDDESLVVGAIKKTVKALPADPDFYREYRPNHETTVEFGEVLFSRVQHQDAELLAIIEPTLKNWDADRVAVIDMILLKMAVCELLSFSSIPSKVTLNEFVEISKLYSTDKSKDFINGILDRLMKKLTREGRLNKENRGQNE